MTTTEEQLEALRDRIEKKNERMAELAVLEPKWRALLKPVDGDDAYDGQTEPPLRDLTPRERDVLCGLLTDIIGEASRTNSVRHIRGGTDWLYHLLVIRQVITPRED